MVPHFYRFINLPSDWQITSFSYFTINEFFMHCENLFNDYVQNLQKVNMISDVAQLIASFIVPQQLLKKYKTFIQTYQGAHFRCRIKTRPTDTKMVTIKHKIHDPIHVDIQELFHHILCNTLPSITMYDDLNPPEDRVDDLRKFLRMINKKIVI